MKKYYLSNTLILLSLTCVISISCRKSHDQLTVALPQPDIKKLAKIEYSGGSYDSYDSIFYNADGNIRKIKKHTGSSPAYDDIYVFDYDSNKKVSHIVNDHGESYEYRYIDGRLTVVDHFVNGKKTDFKDYEYTAGKLSVIEDYYSPDLSQNGFLYTSSRKFYYYPNGNLQLEVHFSNDPQTNIPFRDLTIEYNAYDGKNNPSDQIDRFQYLSQISFAINNPQRKTTKNELTGVIWEFADTYTYDTQSNPVSKKSIFTVGSLSTTETVKYYYY